MCLCIVANIQKPSNSTATTTPYIIVMEQNVTCNTPPNNAIMSEVSSLHEGNDGDAFSRIVEMSLLWEFLHFTDAMNLGSACRSFRIGYKDHEPNVLGPLLTYLENMVGSHRSRYCFHVLAPMLRCTCASAKSRQRPTLAVLDPRYQMSYQAMTSSIKNRKLRCKAMIAFISKIVSNMQSQFDCDDLADPLKLPFTFGTLQEWEFMWTREDDFPMERIMKEMPRRLTFAFNLASLAFAADAMQVGGHASVDDAFLGKGHILSNRSEFGLGSSSILVETVESMLPFRDEDFTAFLKERIHPSDQSVATLGPALSSRLLLCSPKGRQIVLPADLEPELDLLRDETGSEEVLVEIDQQAII